MSKQTLRRRPRDAYIFNDPLADQTELIVPITCCDSLAGHRPGYWVRPLTDAQVAAFDARRRLRSSQTTRDLAAVRDAARSRWLADLNSAWRMDAKRKPDPDDDDDDDDDDDRESPTDRAPARKARDAYVRWLSDQWRPPVVRNPDHGGTSSGVRMMFSRDVSGPGPAATLPAPAAGSAPKRPVPGDDDTREQQYAQRCRDLENAWKSPPGARAPQVVEVGPGIASHVAKVGANPSRAAGIERAREVVHGGA
jgi:hypothetical protein